LVTPQKRGYAKGGTMPREKSDLVQSNDRTAAIIRNLSDALGRMGGGDLDLLRLTGDDHPLHNEIARLLREDFVLLQIEYNEQWLRNMIMKSGLIHVDDVIRRCNYEIKEQGSVIGTHLRLYKLEETLDYGDVRKLLDRFPDWYTANVFELLTFYMRYGRVLNGREVVALGTKMTVRNVAACRNEECCPRIKPDKNSTNPRQMYRMVVESMDTMYSAGTWLLLSHKPEIP